ncbi:MAG TPA: 50S ribosomal protein L3 [Rhabdochlamydiaceae bacterium]|nr:50S ribosomal protein L3 [Rhabdochlamydiaceae bacterium]
MTLRLMGKKKGMTRIFDDSGSLVVCTVIHAEPNVVSQLKTKENDGYAAVQLSALKVKPSKAKNVTKAMKGHFAKAGIDPRSHSLESRLDEEGQFSTGQEVGVEYFADSRFVDVVGVSKGKGYQGVIKRHGFSGGPASHGSGFHRHGGSTGMRSTPGRCLPGQKKAGHMGAEYVTVQNLQVVKVDQDKGLIVVKGAVPGFRDGLVYISKAKKIADQKQAKK